VTSRTELAFDHLDGGTLLSPFSVTEGAEYMMKLVGRKGYSDEEKTAALKFSEDLGGLPLALNLVSAKIRRLSKPIGRYYDQYKQNPAILKRGQGNTPTNIYYPKQLDSVLDDLFEQFTTEDNSEDIIALMGAFSSMAAQGILGNFFLDANEEDLPPSLEFCADEDRYCQSTGQIDGCRR
jgi:hypothetical protein